MCSFACYCIFFPVIIISDHIISGLRNYQKLLISRIKCKLFCSRHPQSMPPGPPPRISFSTKLQHILCSIQNITVSPKVFISRYLHVVAHLDFLQPECSTLFSSSSVAGFLRSNPNATFSMQLFLISVCLSLSHAG